jgi:hypothetical protein
VLSSLSETRVCSSIAQSASFAAHDGHGDLVNSSGNCGALGILADGSKELRDRLSKPEEHG